MKITKHSQLLMTFFSKNKYINHVTHTKRTNKILLELYYDILNAYKYLINAKQSNPSSFYIVNIKKISNSSQISKPNNFNANNFPQNIRIHIEEFSSYEISYSFSLLDRKCKVIFIVEEYNVHTDLKKFNTYVELIIMWLYILDQYASKQCSNRVTIYLYFTSLTKELPSSNIHVLDETNVNTAFTTTCPKDSEIVVFRKEEWFKVFLHETFHNFGLDFSKMYNFNTTKCILNIFQVTSDVNLYEAYCEFWAEIMNALFCSFFSLKDKTNMQEFLSNAETIINFEIMYSLFQLVKTLGFMGLTYKDLYSTTMQSKVLRETMYKEKSNVLAYYVIKSILMNNYQYFLYWCKTNNFSLLQFKQTPGSQIDFCKFVEKYYKTKSMLENVSNAEDLMRRVKTIQNSKNRNDATMKKFLLSNMRMSICEIG